MGDRHEKEEKEEESAAQNQAEEEKDVGPPPMRAERRELELGYSDSRKAEILGGLKEGERVVTVGNSNLRADAPIRFAEKKSEAALTDEKNGLSEEKSP